MTKRKKARTFWVVSGHYMGDKVYRSEVSAKRVKRCIDKEYDVDCDIIEAVEVLPAKKKTKRKVKG